ncbi:hypothetical protein BCR41DRAFT_72838 [Lobosporangium transversale]|uniref:Uncharacterized protein n=1 Tax=Lobosporangium transversale TaxID=64571 RepID=A0A1Y2H2Z7_9FUNG|nr:hypothetical protein BCR41DRAFT_72838 [Lobosporangium transversale]ORZ28361.1 hypothetical protein BCR41DRAFT_72838 [Lobosporangium transversale]|eukprot:XP_021886046.1 hypothetical protein BCR41DRAFT_72838 [Lobosporangium transversale]
MPRVPRCTKFDIGQCSLEIQDGTEAHINEYHSLRTIKFRSHYTGDLLTVDRDPNRFFYYACPHISCNHISNLASDPPKHHKKCRKFMEDPFQASGNTNTNPTITRSSSPVFADSPTASDRPAPEEIEKEHQNSAVTSNVPSKPIGATLVEKPQIKKKSNVTSELIKAARVFFC